MIRQEILSAAKRLAGINSQTEPDIVEIYLFPANDQIRLIELDHSAWPSKDRIVPFYFPPDPGNGLPFPSGIALIPPDDKQKFDPPREWGSWRDAILIWPEQKGS